MITYKVDVLDALKAAGYSSYRLRKDKLLRESTIQKLRNSEPVTIENMNTLCNLLNCQPGDILKHVKDEIKEF